MKKNLFRTMAIAASVTFAVSAEAQTFTWRNITYDTANTTDGHMYIFPLDDNTILGAAPSLKKSTNNGTTWTDVGLSQTSRIIKLSSGKLLACSRLTGGVSVSADNGNTWTNSSQGLPTAVGRSAYDITTDNAGNVYVPISGGSNTDKGIYKSTDEGATWTYLGTNGITGSFQAQCVFTEDGSLILAGAGSKIYRTTDGGANWTTVTVGSGSTNFVKRIKKAGNTIIAATDGGFYTSTDDGVSFSSTGAGYLLSDFVIKGDTVISAGTGSVNGTKVIRYRLSDFTQIDVIGDNTKGISPASSERGGLAMNSAGHLFYATGIKFYTTAPASGGGTGINETLSKNTISVHPNPANDFVSISGIPNSSTLSITDMSGRLVYHLIVRNGQASINTSHFTNGVYLIQVSSKDAVSRQKLVIKK